jgi:quercetin dioxygenase-like cupin family protein
LLVPLRARGHPAAGAAEFPQRRAAVVLLNEDLMRTGSDVRTKLPAVGFLLVLASVPSLADDEGAKSAVPAAAAYSYATNGLLDNIQRGGPGKWKLLLDETNVGGKELSAGELLLAAGTESPSHMHASVEVIYVLSGTYEHEVNGHRYRLTPGMVGIVRPGDHVRHIVPKESDAKLLVIWVPGGDATAQGLRNAKGTTPPPVPEVNK